MDAEGFVRAWTRSRNLVAPENVFFSAPEHDQPPLPLIVFTRVGGPRDHIFDNPLIVWECWGVNKNEASTLAGQLANAIVDQGFAAPFSVDGLQWAGATDPTITPVAGLSWAKRYQVAASVWIHL